MLVTEINFDLGRVETDPLLKRVSYPLPDGREIVIANASPELVTPKEVWQHSAKGLVYLRKSAGEEDLEFVSFPLLKFYNSFEGPALTDMARLPATSQPRIASKEDGTLVQRFTLEGTVYWTTRGRIASLEPENPFWLLLKETLPPDNPLWSPDVFKDTTLVFELVSPRNYIGQFYPENRLVLLAAVKNFAGEKEKVFYDDILRDEYASLDRIQYHSFSTPEEALASIPAERIQEGFVVEYLQEGRVLLRVKYKSQAYLSFLRLKNGINERRVYELCLENGLRSETQFSSFFAANFASTGVYEEILEYAKTVLPGCFTRLAFLDGLKARLEGIAASLSGMPVGRERWERIVKLVDGNTSLAGIVISIANGRPRDVLECLDNLIQRGGLLVEKEKFTEASRSN